MTRNLCNVGTGPILLITAVLCLLSQHQIIAAPPSPGGSSITFAEVTDAAGLDLPLQGLMGHGGAWGDVDGDGDLDLYVGGFADRPDAEYAPADGPVGSMLLLNDKARFRVSPHPDVMYARTSGAVFADLDNDGDLDLYVANNAKPGGKPSDRGERQQRAKPQRSVLYRNDGGQLIDVSQESGACPEALHTARNVGVFDYNNDGLLDLLLIEDRFRKDPRSVLLKNCGDMRFDDVTAAAGLPNDLFGLGHAVADLNEDGRPDFIVGHSNRLFLSQGTDRYVEPESLQSLFAWEPLHGEDWPCGAAFGDLNNDGLLDLVLSIHCETARNKVYLNRGLQQGIPQFADVTEQVGWPASVPAKCPHVELHDFDHDGDLDVFLSAAWRTESSVQPLIMTNLGSSDSGLPRFKAPRSFDSPMVYYPAAPAADFDGDGAVDLFLINWFSGDRCHLLRNTSPAGNWLTVSVRGTSFNRMGIGSRIEVFRPIAERAEQDRTGFLGMRELHIGTGYASGGPASAHFGLGSVDRVDLRVRFPNGVVQWRHDVPVNQALLIAE
ncbi:MAG: CRTAC1 family protein [Planctomycetaceae bacterium]|nr:CRTAC1 family protein [Planctomycetaceae bacterium]